MGFLARILKLRESSNIVLAVIYIVVILALNYTTAMCNRIWPSQVLTTQPQIYSPIITVTSEPSIPTIKMLEPGWTDASGSPISSLAMMMSNQEGLRWSDYVNGADTFLFDSRPAPLTWSGEMPVFDTINGTTLAETWSVICSSAGLQLAGQSITTPDVACGEQGYNYSVLVQQQTAGLSLQDVQFAIGNAVYNYDTFFGGNSNSMSAQGPQLSAKLTRALVQPATQGYYIAYEYSAPKNGSRLDVLETIVALSIDSVKSRDMQATLKDMLLGAQVGSDYYSLLSTSLGNCSTNPTAGPLALYTVCGNAATVRYNRKTNTLDYLILTNSGNQDIFTLNLTVSFRTGSLPIPADLVPKNLCAPGANNGYMFGSDRINASCSLLSGMLAFGESDDYVMLGKSYCQHLDCEIDDPYISILDHPMIDQQTLNWARKGAYLPTGVIVTGKVGYDNVNGPAIALGVIAAIVISFYIFFKTSTVRSIMTTHSLIVVAETSVKRGSGCGKPSSLHKWELLADKSGKRVLIAIDNSELITQPVQESVPLNEDVQSDIYQPTADSPDSEEHPKDGWYSKA
jgi:hypothetical protein